MATVVQAERVIAPAQASQSALVWQRFRRHRAGLTGLIVLALMSLSVIVIPMISPFSTSEANGLQQYASFGTMDLLKNQVHWLGTDTFGRDEMVRLFAAGRVSMFVAFGSAVLIVIVGAIIGATAGYYGGWVDSLLMRFTDLMLAIPLLPMYLFALRLLRGADFLHPWWIDPNINSWLNLGLVMSVFTLFGWMSLARMVRGSVLTLRSLEFVEAARALGAGNRRIIFRHLLPNSVAPIVVAATFAVGDFIILEAILGYFTHGITDPPFPTWGNMLALFQGLALNITNLNPFENVRGYLFLLPSIMILITVLSINYIGDALRNALDPHRAE
ncbi:MAG: peptide/nickel transport system permease protein [Chloroflexia bacterium]|jgi:peptide/nickel transport system permease protein|nr:peptide/nickel transport system permease protein [Chloroflexia bacterium]